MGDLLRLASPSFLLPAQSTWSTSLLTEDTSLYQLTRDAATDVPPGPPPQHLLPITAYLPSSICSVWTLDAKNRPG